MMHNVVAGFLFFFITCAIYLHSRVILLKQDLAIFLFCYSWQLLDQVC